MSNGITLQDVHDRINTLKDLRDNTKRTHTQFGGEFVEIPFMIEVLEAYVLKVRYIENGMEVPTPIDGVFTWILETYIKTGA